MAFGHHPFGHHPFGHGAAVASVIQDLAYNPLAGPATGQMLGYVAPSTPELLGLDIYRFFLASIRKEDEKNALFLKRFLEGPQRVWEQTQTKISTIPNLWDVANIDEEFLPFLKNIVGWTGSLEAITEALDSDTLRRLIATSIPLWRSRGPEDTTVNVLQLTTQAQVRIWNWFDLRWILDETQLGEEHEGRDSWMLESPGSVDMDEQRFNIRIVDDGTLDRTLVRNLVKLMRPSGERVEVTYIDFMDLFTIDGDDAKWTTVEGALEVADGTAKLDDAAQEEIAVATREPTDWRDYVLFGRIRGKAGGRFGLIFYSDEDADNSYRAELDVDSNEIRLAYIVGGAESSSSVVSFAPWGTLYADVYYGVRIQATIEGAQQRIKVYIDGDEIINILHTGYVYGTIGVWHAIGTTAECDEMEMFQLPLTTELVDINS